MLTQIDPPASLAELMLQSVCDHLRVEADLEGSPADEPEDLEYIRALTEAAVAMLDGPSGKLRRCLLNQGWRLSIDYFPSAIEIALPPIQSVDAIRYVDQDGEQQTLDASAYRVTGAGAWLTEIAPAYGEAWPAVRSQPATIAVDFTTGYGDELADVPPPILQAIKFMVGHWYINRAAVESTAFAEVPLSASALLCNFKVFR